MKPLDDLFDLVKRLSIQEKRHFRINANRYASIDKEKKYVRLFDEVLAQSTYDEAELRKKLEGEIPEKSFSSWKRHLISYVEATIRACNKREDSSIALYEKLEDYELLVRRGIWKRAGRKIVECRKIAERTEDFYGLLRVNETERRILIEFEQKDIAKKMQVLLKESNQIMDKIRVEQAYAEIFEEICLLVRLRFDPRDTTISAALPRLRNDKRLQSQTQFPSFKSKRHYLQARAFFFHLADQPKEEFEAYLSLVSHWDTNPDFRRLNLKLYKVALTNCLHAANKLSRWDQFPEILSKAETIPAANVEEEAEDFQTIVFLKHLNLLDRHQLKAAEAMIPEIESGIQKYGEKINHARWLAFKVNICMTYFLSGNFGQALTEIEEILRHTRSDHRADAQALARLLEPVIIFELGDKDLACQKAYALKEWLRTHHRLFEFEQAVVTFIVRMANAQDLKSIFLIFREALRQESIRRVSPQGLEVLSIWLDSKIERRPIAEVFVTNKSKGSHSVT